MKLESWELFAVALPYRRQVVWANAVETASPLLVLKLVAEDGSVGAAEVAVKPGWFGTSFRSITAALEDMFLPLAAGLDACDPGAFVQAAAKIPEHTAAKGLVDNALWDLRSAITRRSLRSEWGGAGQVAVSWLLTRQAPELMAEEAAEAVGRHGFKEIKLKGGQGLETDVRAIRALRAAVGSDIRILVDANAHYRAHEMPEYLAALSHEGVLAAEDPWAMQPDAAFERQQASVSIPILVDAPAWSLRDTALFCERGARALALKPGRSGLSLARAQADLASRAGCRVHVGFGGESALGTVAALQLAASLPGCDDWLAAEVSYFVMLAEQIVDVDLTISGGRIAVPPVVSVAALVDWNRVRRLAARH